MRELSKRIRGQGTSAWSRGGLAGVPFVLGGCVAEQVFATRPDAMLFRGRHPVLDKPLLLKVLRPEQVGDAESERRLVEDARSAGKIHHENVASVVDFGRDEGSDAWYVVSDVAPRETLADVIQNLGPLPRDRAAGVLVQVVRALAVARAAGIPDRVSADNVLLVDSADGREIVKLDVSPPSPAREAARPAVDALAAGLLRDVPPGLAHLIHGFLMGDRGTEAAELERALLAPASDGLLGQMLGPYQVTRLFATDDLGWRYLAQHPVVGARVAVRVLRRDVPVDPYVKRTTALNAIGSASLPRVYGFGTLPSGETYAVLDAAEGEALSERLRRDGRLPLAETGILLRQVAEAMSQAHQAGIVHGRLDGERLLVTRDEDGWPLVRILDFGAPDATAADDVRALGTVAMQMLGAGTIAALPEKAVGAVSRMLAAEASARPVMSEVVDLVAAWSGTERREAVLPPPARGDAGDDAPLPTSRRWPYLVAAVLGLALIGGIALFVMRREDHGAPTAALSPPPPAEPTATPDAPVVEKIADPPPPAPVPVVEPAAPAAPEKAEKPKKKKKKKKKDAAEGAAVTAPADKGAIVNPFEEPAPPPVEPPWLPPADPPAQ